MVITAVLPDRPEGYSCSDCGHVFKTSLACAEHAFNKYHMGGRSCLLCNHFFHTLDDVRAHHASYHEAGPPKRADEATSTTTKYPDHFSPQHWRQSNDMEAALRDRPGYGYPWASPALSEDVCALLTPELLSTQRLAHHGFPLSASAHARSPNTNSNTNTTAWRNSPLPLPAPSSARKTYAALVIDCEMVQLADGAQDLVRISVVDFVSGASLLNYLVQPTGRVRQWNARVSGVHPQLLRAAKDDPAVTVLAGWQDARARLFALADARTVLLGHALWNDLKILRIVAPRVVDSAVLTAQAVFGRDADTEAGMGGARLHFPRTWSLKACCAAMGVAVQRSGVAHDSLEDALATRELVLWCLTKPGALRAWGVQAREEHERKMEALRVKREAEAEARKVEEQRKKQEALEERLAAMKLGEEVRQAAVARVENTWS